MRRYESYKDSGVEWLGEVPSHWNLIPNKYIFKLRKNVVGKRSSEYDLLSLSLKGVIKRDMANPKGKFPAEFDTYQEVKEGDFIFCLFDVEETPRTVGLSSYHGMITGAYTIFETNNVDKKFIYYFYLNLDSDKRLKPLYKGLRNTISKETFFSFNTFIPPLSEQQKIAQFLNDKTAKIDQAVDLAEKQIALLKEHKQILIQNAVTRGLNPDVPLKDSGVEWIGQVPEHWDVQRSKFIFKKIERKVNEEDQIVTCFRDGQVTLRANRRTEGFTNALKEHGYQGIRKGDLVIHAMDAFAGAIGISDSDGKATPVYSVCLPHDKQKIDVYFYAYYLRNLALSGFIRSLAKGIRERSTDFRYADFAELLLPIPPYLEQQKIADYLDKQTSKIDQAIALKTAHIEKLKEYKSVLINDVVTGKVRV
ncbi:TPA: restriction endonuclease subunit S [Haemophilus influenzae]